MAKKVVIVGAGFGGLSCAKALRKSGYDITIVDQKNHHLFQPLLYQVATAGLSPAEIAVPIRALVRNIHSCKVLMDSVQEIRLSENKIVLEVSGEVAFDFLVLATGARHAYFGNPDWEADAPGLKSLDDATEIRKRILLAFETAELVHDLGERRRQLTFAIVGAGPTGVELAGAISELAERIIAEDFDSIRSEKARVLLVEGGQRILSSFPEPLSSRASKDLNHLGVEVLLNSRVIQVTDSDITILQPDGSKKLVPCSTVVWAAGVEAQGIASWLGVEPGPGGRVAVTPECNVPGLDNVFVIGDASYLQIDGKVVPGVSPAAMQMGRYVADRMMNRTTASFTYKDKGSMATIGRGRAICHIGKLQFGGPLAWFAWLFLHIFYLIGFKNKILVLIQWAWAYLTFQRGARLITGQIPFKKKTGIRA